MSGIYSTTPNYSGRQGDNVQGIKQFVTSSVGVVDWIYKSIVTSTKKVITPYDQTKTVMIPKDLLVLGSINNPSDITLKDNIEQINIDNFNKLNPVSFTFKDDEQNKKHYGFIAQELETVYPELVTNTELGFKFVNYIEMIPILLSQMKNMQMEIDKLKDEIKEIKGEKI
jgi:hypothetical protein